MAVIPTSKSTSSCYFLCCPVSLTDVLFIQLHLVCIEIFWSKDDKNLGQKDSRKWEKDGIKFTTVVVMCGCTIALYGWPP